MAALLFEFFLISDTFASIFEKINHFVRCIFSYKNCSYSFGTCDFHLCPANRGTRSRQNSPPGTVGGYGRLGYGTKILSTHTLTVSESVDYPVCRAGGDGEAEETQRRARRGERVDGLRVGEGVRGW